MGRKRIETADSEELEKIEVPTDETNPVPEEEANSNTEVTTQTEIPEQALRVMKIFSSQPKMYINSFGGVFSVDTAEAIRGNAVLYDNPFYKS